MIVNRSIQDDRRFYELILSRNDFNHLCAGCPELDSVIGYCRDDGLYFRLFNGVDKISGSFRRMPGGDEYFIYIGAPTPALPPDFKSEDFDRLSQEFYDNLEKTINESGKIPVEEEMGALGKINLGYVTMKINHFT